ncbi:MAG: hypothetical protein KME30_26125 [Iphinoe sp. HA4291-MV1]|jgi:hypothetical protein|nr:hypothetical protein [Iphinoe sp. HA4291-MV1]
MGIAASLFFSYNTQKQTLHRRIVPSDEQRETQQQRWNDLAEYLKTDLKEVSGYSIYSWLQGSYKFATQLRPLSQTEESDIDLGIYFEWRGEPEDGDFSPLQLKKMVQESIERYAKNQADIREVATPKKWCNRIHYDGGFHIDVPTYHLDSSRDARALVTEDDEWEDSDPKAIYVWFKEQVSEEVRPQVQRLIRYLKAWAILNIKEEEKPSAILLTVLVAESYANLREDEVSGDDEALAAIVSLILERLKRNSKVYNPVNTAEILSDRLGQSGITAFINHLDNFSSIAQQAMASDSEFEAADFWSKIYKYFFPLPEAQEAKFSESRAFVPLVFVEAKRKKQLFQKVNQWSGSNGIFGIPKNCTISFELKNYKELPYSATVEWTVRNEGKEAENLNDIGHLAGTGFFATESSAYRGRHYMDCVVRQYDGNIIAVRRVPVHIV